MEIILNTMGGFVFPAIVLVLLAFVLLNSLFTVSEKTNAVVERFGQFVRIARPGLNFKIPFIERVAAVISLRVQQLVVPVETKTEDNVFVQLKIAVQYQVLPDKVPDAAYRLEDPEEQIKAYVFDTVRATVPKMKLDNLFERKEEIAISVQTELKDSMDDFGYQICKALVTDIDPDAEVKRSMNTINAAQRDREAAQARAEAERIMKVTAAQAEAESMKLHGQGIADQRAAIIHGLEASVSAFQKAIPGAQANDVMQLVVLTQYMDTLKEMTRSGQSKVILMPSDPGGVNNLVGQLRNAFTISQEIGAGSPRPDDGGSQEH